MQKVSMNNTISYFKNHPFIAVVSVIITVFVVTEITTKAVSGLFGTSSNIVSNNRNIPVLEKFLLNKSKTRYVEIELAKLGKGARVKTFIANINNSDTNDTHSSRVNYPVFDVVIHNPASEQSVITKIMYNIDDIGQVLGVGPGPVDSKYQYTSKLEYKKGVQEYELVSPIVIPAQSSASFELAMFTEHPEIGLSWWTNIEFNTDQGNVSTDMFQVILSGRPKWALKVLQPPQTRRKQMGKGKEFLSPNTGLPQPVTRQEAIKIPLPETRHEGGIRRVQEGRRESPRTPTALR